MNKIEQLIERLCPNGIAYYPLGNVCKFQRGQSITKKDISNGNIPVIAGGQTPAYYHNVYNRDGETISISSSGAYAGFVSYWDQPVFLSDSFSVNPDSCLKAKFVYHFLKSIQKKIYGMKKGSGVPHVHGSSISKFEIPVPPLEIQEEIVKILDNFTELDAELEAELEARKKQYEYYRNLLFAYNKEIACMCLDSVILSLKTGLNPRNNFKLNTSDAKNYYITVRELGGKNIILADKTDKINDEALCLINNRSKLEVGDILFSGTGTIGRTALISNIPLNWNIKEGVYVIKPKLDKIYPLYLLYYLNSERAMLQIKNKTVGSPVSSIPMAELKKIKVPIISLKEQERIASTLDKFNALVNDISQGLPAEIAARRKQYEYYREKLLTFKRLDNE